jgi:threonine aldolase
MEFIDLRSDTVTKPTPEMREAMAKAEVGDDVYGDDPTVNRLQEMAAEMMGKEAGLFVPSGTMGNLASILAHCQRGDEVIIGRKNHSFLFEAGGISVLGGVHSCQLDNQPDGSLLLEDIEAAIRPDDPHDPITRLICLENTHNRCGGTVQTPEYTRRVAELAHARGLKIHLDGARLFNAAAKLNVCACGIRDLWRQGIYQESAPPAQDVGRRNETGRRVGRGRNCGIGENDGALGRGPRAGVESG